MLKFPADPAGEWIRFALVGDEQANREATATPSVSSLECMCSMVKVTLTVENYLGTQKHIEDLVRAYT
ncbi:hypothetical protein PR048_014115 [Dryococelus australis]|uniref:Uncharacterized protein n=1 Tax=Dryococelus australis TaxID=614101 RepID=A0ABQ9HDC5_9NEOP|nr:hypothetical protein PR048_014115 [Dryococelus australis]